MHRFKENDSNCVKRGFPFLQLASLFLVMIQMLWLAQNYQKVSKTIIANHLNEIDTCSVIFSNRVFKVIDSIVELFVIVIDNLWLLLGVL